MKLKTLLVPTDFSKGSGQALDYAQELATHFQSALVLLHVVEPIPPFPVDLPADSRSGLKDLHLDFLTQAEESMAQLAAQVSRRIDTPVLHRTKVGRAYQEIVDAARDEKADLIVIATHGRTGLGRFLMGSTAEMVVRHASCPVFLVRVKENDLA
jgi:nucleotide-binding universal stress UspA family protein